MDVRDRRQAAMRQLEGAASLPAAPVRARPPVAEEAPACHPSAAARSCCASLPPRGAGFKAGGFKAPRPVLMPSVPLPTVPADAHARLRADNDARRRRQQQRACAAERRQQQLAAAEAEERAVREAERWRRLMVSREEERRRVRCREAERRRARALGVLRELVAREARRTRAPHPRPTLSSPLPPPASRLPPLRFKPAAPCPASR